MRRRMLSYWNSQELPDLNTRQRLYAIALLQANEGYRPRREHPIAILAFSIAFGLFLYACAVAGGY